MIKKRPTDVYFDLLCQLSSFYINHTKGKDVYYV